MLDLQSKGAGVYNVPIELVAPDVVVQSLSPASVTLDDRKASISARFPLAMHYVGTATAGLVVKSNPQLQAGAS